MVYEPFHCTCRGKAHIAVGLPCQDFSNAVALDEQISFAVVADGHGNAIHSRSDRGARIACGCAQEAVAAMLAGGFPKNENPAERDERLNDLKRRILCLWQERVMEDMVSDPLTEEETARILTRFPDGDKENEALRRIAYGTTLCAVWACETGWESIQQGDSSLTVIDREGHFLWLMPMSSINQGNRTASLCMRDPMRDFRHCFGDFPAAALLVYTDGIEKIFPLQGMELISLLHWIRENQLSGTNREENLRRNLEMLTERSYIGDDVSIAGLTDSRAEAVPPVYTEEQLQLYLQRIRTRRKSAEQAILYNESCMKSLLPEQEETAGQIRSILARKRAELETLVQQEEAFLSLSRKDDDT